MTAPPTTLTPLPLAAELDQVLTPRRRLTVVEWGEQYLRLDKTHAIPGLLSWGHSPFWLEIALALTDGYTDETTVVACTQSGKTLLGNAWLGWVVDQSPGTFLDVMPTEPAVRKRIDKGIRPMFKESERLARHCRPEDITYGGFQTAEMFYYSGHAGSAVALSDLPCPYVRMDETGKFAEGVGKEGGPVGQGRARQRTFHESMLLVVSSPVLEGDVIDREYEAGDRGEHYGRCPHCGELQILTWDNVVLTKGTDGHLLDHRVYLDGAHGGYVCPGCGVEWSEADRWSAVCEGVWFPEELSQDKRLERVRIWQDFRRTRQDTPAKRAVAIDRLVERLLANHKARHRSFRIPALMVNPMFTTVADLASRYALAIKHLRAGKIKDLQNFINLELAEPWRESEKKMQELSVKRHISDAAFEQVPAAAKILTCGIDVQQEGFYLVVLAWGYQYESWLIWADYMDSGYTDDAGRFVRGSTKQLKNFEVIRERILGSAWPQDGADKPIGLSGVGIDSSDGTRTDEVYDFCDRVNNPTLCFPLKGDAKITRPPAIRPTDLNREDLTRRRRGKRFRSGMTLWRFSPLVFKARLWRWTANENPGEGYIHFPANVSDEFIRQFTSQELRTERKGGKIYRVWRNKRGRSANHYFDAAAMAAVGADLAGVGQLGVGDQGRVRLSEMQKRPR